MTRGDENIPQQCASSSLQECGSKPFTSCQPPHFPLHSSCRRPIRLRRNDNNFAAQWKCDLVPPTTAGISTSATASTPPQSQSSPSSLQLQLASPTETVWSCDLCGLQKNSMTSREFWQHCLGASHLALVQQAAKNHEQRRIPKNSRRGQTAEGGGGGERQSWRHRGGGEEEPTVSLGGGGGSREQRRRLVRGDWRHSRSGSQQP